MVGTWNCKTQELTAEDKKILSLKVSETTSDRPFGWGTIVNSFIDTKIPLYAFQIQCGSRGGLQHRLKREGHFYATNVSNIFLLSDVQSSSSFNLGFVSANFLQELATPQTPMDAKAINNILPF